MRFFLVAESQGFGKNRDIQGDLFLFVLEMLPMH